MSNFLLLESIELIGDKDSFGQLELVTHFVDRVKWYPWQPSEACE